MAVPRENCQGNETYGIKGMQSSMNQRENEGGWVGRLSGKRAEMEPETERGREESPTGADSQTTRVQDFRNFPGASLHGTRSFLGRSGLSLGKLGPSSLHVFGTFVGHRLSKSATRKGGLRK
ncbi:hypothetical protein NL676_032331 [Syzygium grande]|nr:hypothetical protein NL676_032331 [Syzygium grande]